MEKHKSESEHHSDTLQEIFLKINEARINPLKLANKITLSMSYINKRDNILKEPNKPTIKLNEGIKGYEEAITYLKNFSPIEELKCDATLNKLVQEYTDEITHKNSALDSVSLQEDKLKFEERCRKFATYEGIKGIVILDKEFNNTNNNINSQNQFFDSAKLVMNLLICDGDFKRNNRNLILNNEFKFMGVGLSSLSSLSTPQSQKYCVIVLCKNWKIRKLDENLNQLGKSLVNLNLMLDNENNESESNQNNNKLNIQQNNGIPYIKKTKLKDFNFGLDVIDKRKPTSDLDDPFLDEDLVLKYDKELDKEINFEEYMDKREFKQIITEGEKIKLIKKISFTFMDGSVRKIILSKTWKSKDVKK
jgi:hypothetical protein